jgi:hypothetical protein
MAIKILVFSLAFHLRILLKKWLFPFFVNKHVLVKKTSPPFPDFLFAVCMVSLRRNECGELAGLVYRTLAQDPEGQCQAPTVQSFFYSFIRIAKKGIEEEGRVAVHSSSYPKHLLQIVISGIFSSSTHTVKKVIDFPVPSRDITNQTLPGRD